MKRKIYQKLLEWKNSSTRKPLLLQGARQVGKTYIVNYFGGKEYANIIYCNFEKELGIDELFNDLNPHNIIKRLSIYKRKSIMPENSLIIFDEIQASPKAITSLKYFNEEANEFHVIATGSLLGVSVNRNQFSFPVGKVNFLTMYPMDFEEYLLAREEEYLIEAIKKSFEQNTPIETLFHERLIEYYKEYLFVGGMPEVVENYLKNNNLEMVRIAQQNIIDAYLNDMGKYNKQTEIPKTKLVYKNICTQLAKENRKFQYKLIKTGGRAKEFENAIEWLCLSGISTQLYKVNDITLPLKSNMSLSDFKFYMNDVGLLCASQNVYYDDIITDSPFASNFKGGLTENYVFNQLTFNGLDLYYWTSGNLSEVDFVTRIDLDIIPIEVKSSINTRSKSLSVYADKFNPKYAIRLSLKNFGFENNIKSVPLYAAFCIKKNLDKNI